MFEKNQVFTAEIIDITSEGNGVCRINDVAVFVPQTAVGDVVEVKIVKVLSHYAYGIVNKLVLPSPDRLDNRFCKAYKKCGGCVFRHISYEAECKVKDNIVKEAFRRIGGLDPEFDDFICADNTERYRNKAQYPLAVQDGKAVCGFYAPRSHRVIPIDDCPLQPEIFSEIVKCCLDFINEKKLSVYDEKTHTGILRHIYLRKGTYSNQIMVCLVVRKDFSRQLYPLAHVLHHKFSEIFSVIMNINPDKTNVILGDKWISLYGCEEISDTMCGNEIIISPPSFYQVNTVQAEKIYAKALEYANLEPTDTIVDLYCGAGTIGLSMADKVLSVIGIEIVPEAVYDAKRNAKINEIYNAEFYCGDAGEVFENLRQKGCTPDIILLDPPRKGCSEQTLDTVISANPKKIVMISCNPSTAARDAKTLSENGYTAEKVCGCDFFPATRHVEVVLLLSRQNNENE
ncbi:MAG: 23S rRNA (uracil(1939)-C(5))-methyltransferase RlmD [Ruminococcus sp.]|nr:23S rRNA (uracil(1939)-C(5))-methyltransferase RlmD [Ruminococcus sp.]